MNDFLLKMINQCFYMKLAPVFEHQVQILKELLLHLTQISGGSGYSFVLKGQCCGLKGLKRYI